MPLSQSRAGQPPCSSKACRNLFGPVDHQQLQQDFEDKMRQQLEEAQQRWNFNFETETPLEGQFKWERILVAEQQPQEVHSLVRAVISSDSRSPLAHRDHAGRICPEESQQSSKVYKAGSMQSLKRGQTTIKGECWGLVSLPGGLVALMSWQDRQRGLSCPSPAWLLGMGRVLWVSPGEAEPISQREKGHQLGALGLLGFVQGTGIGPGGFVAPKFITSVPMA